MKNLILILSLVTSLNLWANYQKPQLLALSFSPQNYNLPLNTYCYLGTPVVIPQGTLLVCLRDNFHDLIMWDKNQKPQILHSSLSLISTPQYFDGTITWYEYDQEQVIQAFQWKDNIKTEIAIRDHARSVTYLGDKWIYHTKKNLYLHRGGFMQSAPIDHISYIFTPASSVQGDYAVKLRRESLADSSPDEIWAFRNDKWIKVISDRDGDPHSPWISFHNSLAVGDGKVYVIARDDVGDALIEISDNGVRELVRKGVDIASFESFTIAYNNGAVVFRGIDFSKRKVVYVVNKEGLQSVLTQGDTLATPGNTTGIVDYPKPNSIIYNNPAIGENGEVVIQATVLNFDDRDTVLGIGVLSIKKDDL